jgi:hypothetical protein
VGGLWASVGVCGPLWGSVSSLWALLVYVGICGSSWCSVGFLRQPHDHTQSNNCYVPRCEILCNIKHTTVNTLKTNDMGQLRGTVSMAGKQAVRSESLSRLPWSATFRYRKPCLSRPVRVSSMKPCNNAFASMKRQRLQTMMQNFVKLSTAANIDRAHVYLWSKSGVSATFAITPLRWMLHNTPMGSDPSGMTSKWKNRFKFNTQYLRDLSSRMFVLDLRYCSKSPRSNFANSSASFDGPKTYQDHQ